VNDRETSPYRRIADLERENAALREQIDDWENAVLHALDHRPDEQHCTCVAPLVGKVKQLERENAALREDKERLDSGRIMLVIHDSDGWKDCEFKARNLRAAIDAARKEKP